MLTKRPGLSQGGQSDSHGRNGIEDQEATNGPRNWGKFLIGRMDLEWARASAVHGAPKP
jgi:hypothetical protein